MKILLPFQKNLNPYLDEIQKFSEHSYIYDNYRNYNSSYKIVNIHWPEAIFDWKEPSNNQIDELENLIKKWKRSSILVYTKHDETSLKGMTENLNKLFALIEKNTDLFIHLGNYSKELYQKKYPAAKHEVVCHPLYINSFNTYKKEEARKLLNIDSEAVVIIAPGNIRNFTERKMILSAFKKLDIKNKVLIATKMRTEIKYDFPGRVKLKRFFDIRNYVVNKFKQSHQPPKYLFTYEKLSTEDLALKMSAADIVLIPRVKILNSGNLFLGLTFNKIVIGPATGNIKEQLEKLNLPVFDPHSSASVLKAINDGIVLSSSGKFKYHNLEKYKSETVADKIDSLFNKM